MISNDIENKQIELAEKLSNYNEILQFVKNKIPEDELDIYLSFFDKSKTKPKIISEVNYPENGKIITMWGDEI